MFKVGGGVQYSKRKVQSGRRSSKFKEESSKSGGGVQNSKRKIQRGEEEYKIQRGKFKVDG
jgi:hypothetical protein